jgi:hypothetical protein
MRTITVRVRVGEPRRNPDGTIGLGLDIIGEGIHLEAGESAALNMGFPVGPDDVGLVLPVDVDIYRADEKRQQRPPAKFNVALLEAARAELARQRSAGEVPPISAEAQAVLATLRSRLEGAGGSIRVSAGLKSGERATSNRVKVSREKGGPSGGGN